MGREIKRVIEGFDWPLNKTWEGFLTPEWLHEGKCPDCTNGYSREAEIFHQEWYGHAPFDPMSTGSTPLTADTPAVHAFAQQNVDRSPSFYGTGPAAVHREGERLAKLWNSQWAHHLSQVDVDALVDEGRLWYLSRGRDGSKGKTPPHRPTAAEVNTWSLTGFGHDSINASIIIKARCEREGVPRVCGTCKGHASMPKFTGQRKVAEKWKPLEPPKGNWWQIWETVSEGSPVTPAFATPEALAEHVTAGEPSKYAGTLKWITSDGWAPSMAVVGGVLSSSADLIAAGGLSQEPQVPALPTKTPGPTRMNDPEVIATGNVPDSKSPDLHEGKSK